MEARIHRAIKERALPLSRAAAALSAVLLTACSGTGDGGSGDPPVEPRADPFGSCSRIADLQGDAPWFEPSNTDSAGCNYPVNRHVCVSGATIVAIDRFDETGQGQVGNFYVEDTTIPPAPSSGVTVYNPSFSPPDLRLAVGDVVDVLGTFQEFAGPTNGEFEGCRTLPEIGGAMSLRFENGSVTALPIKMADLTAYESARRYIGMLVKVEGVKLGEPVSSKGRYTIPILGDSNNPNLSNELFDLASVGLTNGSTLSSVTGIVTYFYGFKIAPRSAEDLAP